MSKIKIKAIRGMNDILPTETIYWQYLETIFRELAASYCYREIRTPLLESTDLFHRSVGEATDIVEKETYTFDDRNGDSLTLRPEGTAGTVRAGIEHGLFYNQVQRLWYMGPIFRHERPQKGRYRQFFQIGLEAFGMPGVDIELEQLRMTARLWRQLGISAQVHLEINTLGSFAERQAFAERLVTYFSEHHAQLDEDSQRRLHKNPLRILDSKNPAMQDLIANAPKMDAELSEASKQHFAQICDGLTAADISYTINPRLVRGLDYYCHTVFEWVSNDLGAQGTVCAGGRYDGLVNEIGGDAVPAVGCAMGIERLLLLMQANELKLSDAPDVYLISTEAARSTALQLAEKIRDELPHLKCLTHCGAGSFKSQMKRADKYGAQMALILGDDELANQTITLKNLRETGAQETVSQAQMCTQLHTVFK